MLYSKNGSIPKPETDGTEGWLEVEMPPTAPEGKEVVWLNWEWVVRDPKPADRDGYRWKWNHDQMQWVEYELPGVQIQAEPTLESAQIVALDSSQLSAMSTEQIGAL